MWNLKNNINKVESLIDTESGLVVPEGRGVRGLGERGDEIKKYKWVDTK